ncbi:MAG: zinc ribbon domain-containing protein [Candidatus Heimdallarchaeaceae archaeon]
MKRRTFFILNIIIVLLLPPTVFGKVIINETESIAPQGFVYWTYSAPQSMMNVQIDLSVLNETHPVILLVLDIENYFSYLSLNGSDFSSLTTILNSTDVVNGFFEFTVKTTEQIYIVVENNNTEYVYVQMLLSDETPENSPPATIYTTWTPLISNIFIYIGVGLFLAVIFSIFAVILKRKNNRTKLKQRITETTKIVPTIFNPSESPAGTTKFCTSCGREISVNEKYCSFCGEKI